MLPDDFGTNTNKKRLREFPDNIKSFIGSDINTLLPRLPGMFRLVLCGQFLRDNVKNTLFQTESASIFLILTFF